MKENEKTTVIAYITCEGDQAFLNVLDYDSKGGKFHKFPVNNTACQRLASETATYCYLGQPHTLKATQ